MLAYNKKSANIPIASFQNENSAKTCEYGLKHNFFDPSSRSPPNNFMQKLEVRMKHLHCKKVDNLDKV